MNKKGLVSKVVYMPKCLHNLQTLTPCEFLKNAGYFEFYSQISEKDIVDFLVNNPECIQLWLQYSADQRCIPTWIFHESKTLNEFYEVSYFTDDGIRSIHKFSDVWMACAFYIKKELEVLRTICITK